MTALTLQLSDEEMAALHLAAEREGVSADDFVRRAIADRATGRSARLRDAVARIAEEDAELLDRLGR